MSAAASPWDLSRPASGREVVCAATGEVLAPGTPCRSVLVPADEPQGTPPPAQPAPSPFQRVDVSEAAWEAGHRPPRLYSHWRSSVPDPAKPSREPLDLAGLLELLERLGEEDAGAQEGRPAFRFVLALLLLRRRMLRLDDTRRRDGRSVWCFTRKEDAARGPMGRWAEGETIEVADPGLSDADAAAVAEQLHETLGVEPT